MEPEIIQQGTSLTTVFIISIMTMFVGLIGKILWDWLKNRKEEKGIENRKPVEDLTSDERFEDFKKQLNLLETNHMEHIKEKLKENKEEILNIWKEINLMKKDVSDTKAAVSFIRGKLNGGK